MNNKNKNVITGLILLVLAGAIIWQFDLARFITGSGSNDIQAAIGQVIRVEAEKIYIQSESGEKVVIIQSSTRFLSYDSAAKTLNSGSRSEVRPGVKVSVTYKGSGNQKQLSAQFVTILNE